jgi:MFS family permease
MTRRQRWTLVATIIGSGAVFLDGTLVGVALKRIGQDLPASLVGVLEGQAYVVSGYLAILAALLILAGALSDHYGRRRVYAIGLTGFALTSALCGLADARALVLSAPGGRRRLLIPGFSALSPHAFEGRARTGRAGIWAASTSALTVRAIFGGIMVGDRGGSRS